MKRKLEDIKTINNINNKMEFSEEDIKKYFGEELCNEDGDVIIINKLGGLDDIFRQRCISSMNVCASNSSLMVLEPLKDESNEIIKIFSDPTDQIALISKSTKKGELLSVSDGISYEPLSPFQLVEYNYEEKDGSEGEWKLSCIGIESLQYFLSSKFGLWKENMLNAFGGCAAAFLPELKRGYALTNIYDSMIFPMNDIDKEAWEIMHNGKIVSIPRPVKNLRVWNSSTQEYNTVSSIMKGAPNPSETKSYWESFLNELRESLNSKYGEDFIDDCINMENELVKQKYGF